ncbi:unnamed protein product [Oppiella nova]|uniref:Protein alan shepard n=1 Tax=Oppiella nova TaxID=334625 RepID=A0A7R9QKH2_9ACAR|nr:unnamed protein product [Oppiella nova]CAG2167640.1 unnamed protein product [Oppiella nova]
MSSSKRMMGSNNTNGDGIDNSKTNLIINYLPQQMTDQDFRVLFAQIGDIRSAKIIRKKSTGYSYGFGFVDYLRPEDAERAIDSLNGHLVEHKKIKVAFARPSTDSIKQANLYVKNLPINYSDHDVRELFSPFGNIIQCRLVGNRGVAFVLYDLHEQALQAIDQINGKVLPGAGAGLNVKFANDNNQKYTLAEIQTTTRRAIGVQEEVEVEEEGKLISSPDWRTSTWLRRSVKCLDAKPLRQMLDINDN